jgi:hypothetical protein
LAQRLNRILPDVVTNSAAIEHHKTDPNPHPQYSTSIQNLADTKVSRAGDTMTGTLNVTVGGQTVTVTNTNGRNTIYSRRDNWDRLPLSISANGVYFDTASPQSLAAQGGEATALTRKDYVDGQVATRLPLTGGTLSGSLTVGPYAGPTIGLGNGDGCSAVVSNLKIGSWFGIGFTPTIGNMEVPTGENAVWIDVRGGDMWARGNISAYASDERLKLNFRRIDGALDKVCSIDGYSFEWDYDKCFKLGFAPKKGREHGFKASDIKRVLPDATSIAPFDRGENGESRSGDEYLTVDYAKVTPLLVAAVKELRAEVIALRAEVAELRGV